MAAPFSLPLNRPSPSFLTPLLLPRSSCVQACDLPPEGHRGPARPAAPLPLPIPSPPVGTHLLCPFDSATHASIQVQKSKRLSSNDAFSLCTHIQNSTPARPPRRPASGPSSASAATAGGSWAGCPSRTSPSRWCTAGGRGPPRQMPRTRMTWRAHR